LNLGRNKITDTGIRYIVQSLQNNNVLTKLTIDSCYIKEKGAHFIARLLENNTVSYYGFVFILLLLLIHRHLLW